MKVKLRNDYAIRDIEDEKDEVPVLFSKGEEYEVVHQLESECYGLDDHTVYIIINDEGDSMSLSKEVCDVVIEQ